jgi:hypothetical protein
MNGQRIAGEKPTMPVNVLYRIRFYGEVRHDRRLRLQEARSPIFYRGTLGDYLVHRTGWARWISVRCAWCRIRSISVGRRAVARFGGPTTCPSCLRRFIVDASRPESIAYPLLIVVMAVCSWRSYISGAFVPLALFIAVYLMIEVSLTLLAPQRRP